MQITFRRLCFLFLLLSFVLSHATLNATVFLQENFDSWPTQEVNNTFPNGLDGWLTMINGSSCTTHNSVTHCSGEIGSPGRDGTGKSYRLWRYGSDFSGYDPGMYTTLSTGASTVYIRWYMKIPTAFDIVSNSNYQKLWRVNVSSGSAIYLEAYGSDPSFRTSGYLGINIDQGTEHPVIGSGKLPITIWDGNWHCLEFQLGLANSTLKFWLDGNLYYSSTNFDWSGAARATFNGYFQHFPLGNRATSPLSVMQSSWQALEVDDLVIADSYIGPISGGGGTTPPPTGGPGETGQILLTEAFDDNSFASRGWFDGTPTSAVLDSSTKQSGAGSIKWTWAPAATAPTGMQTIRHDFTATDSLYLSFYWRFNTDWVGSGQSYHPHLIYILSDLDDQWGGLAWNYLDTYIETNVLTPRINLQDGSNINTNPTPPWATTRGTETRAVAGCNGVLAGADAGNGADCYSDGTYWYNGMQWDAPSVRFVRNTWQHVEVYLKMNTISGGVGQPNGIIQMSIDGALAINKTNVVYRTNQHPTLKWRTLVIAPYIGDGSPQTQTMWMDSLTVATGLGSTLGAPEGLTTKVVSP